jgi:DNA-binding LacI/PurR family transcriptional regulator
MRRIKLEDLAADCGVSVATVSRALADKPGVREELRARVRDAAIARGYSQMVPLLGQRVALVASRAAMLDLARSQFTLHVVAGLRERAQATGMVLETITATGTMAEAIDASDADGFLLLSPKDDEEIERARALGRPVVLVNAEDAAMQLSSVTPCNRAAAAAATSYLLNKGHRKIIFMTCPGRRTIAERYAGWFEAMQKAGIVPDEKSVIEVDDWLPDLAAEAIRSRLIAGPRDFTALFCAGDSLAIGALIGLASEGVSVPKDVSVLGFDGLPQCELQMPPLSAVEIPMHHMGAVALDLLRDEMLGNPLPARRVELACHVVERAST